MRYQPKRKCRHGVYLMSQVTQLIPGPHAISSFLLSFSYFLRFDVNFFFVLLALASGCGACPRAQLGALVLSSPEVSLGALGFPGF